ncbi:MAG: winged helix-turn-helix transcriptional regulator [Candidatus Kerfeldbacteria bacterium]|nr:winged helix-turn-helix transcriptional regulator [Candidatus Kerfeldbacteria bacterium]
MHTHPHLRNQALVYRALGNERRLFILQLLKAKPRTGKELIQELGIRAPAVSRHLSVLLQSAIITSLRQKECVLFWLHPKFNLNEALLQHNLFAKRFIIKTVSRINPWPV